VAQPTLDVVETFVDRASMAGMRIAIRGGEVLGGLVLFGFGQFFGGRSVPMTGVSAVAVSPEHRSKGVGRALMLAALREMASRRVPISGLYPATQPVYRRLGWEIAGVRQMWSVPTSALASRVRTPDVRPMLTEDRAAVHACYHEFARRRAGLLDRNDWAWKRVLESPDFAVRSYVVEAPRGRGIEGYVVTMRKPKEGVASDLLVRDLVALTPRAHARLLALLGDHRSVAAETKLWIGPGEAAFIAPEEQERKLEWDWRFMNRIVDVARAVESRGYPEGLSCEVGVAIEDETLPGNRGRWILGCAGGRGFARRAPRSQPRTTLHVRGLAAIYTGHSSAAVAEAAGLASGPQSDLAALSAMFAGPAPWTPDMW
jgi:predicted acetyltransferase